MESVVLEGLQKPLVKGLSSTADKPKHEDCPEGSTSWCSYQRDIASGTQEH